MHYLLCKLDSLSIQMQIIVENYELPVNDIMSNNYLKTLKSIQRHALSSLEN